MFVLEFVTQPPAGVTSSYFSLTVRSQPYTFGRLETNDISIPDAKDISRQHATLSVVRYSAAASLDLSTTVTHLQQQKRQHQSNASSSPVLMGRSLFMDDDESSIPIDSVDDDQEDVPGSLSYFIASLRTEHNERSQEENRPTFIEDLEVSDPLVLRILNCGKFGFTAHAPNGKKAAISSTAFVGDGWALSFGSVTFRVTYRPVIVSVARDYAPAFVTELEMIFATLGATCTHELGPLPSLLPPPTDSALLHGSSTDHQKRKCEGRRYRPILCAHVAEEISDDSWSLLALAAGYTIVLPSYIIEWFAALSECCSIPLHELPPPYDHEPSKNTATFGSLQYHRPEPSTCPFSLYPMPMCSVRPPRSRHELLSNKALYFPSEVSLSRNRSVVEHCGGLVLDTLRQVIRFSTSGQPGRRSPDQRRAASPPVFGSRFMQKFIVLDQVLAAEVATTDVKVAIALRKQKLRQQAELCADAADQATRASSAAPTGGGDDDAMDHTTTSFNRTMLDDGGGLPLMVNDADDREEAEKLKLFASLKKLSDDYGWTMVSEGSLHGSLLTNIFSPVTIHFAERSAVKELHTDACCDDDVENEQLADRAREIEERDSEVYAAIAGTKGHVNESTRRHATNPALERTRLSTTLASPPPRLPRNDEVVDRGIQEVQEGECDSDRTPSVVSEADGVEGEDVQAEGLDGQDLNFVVRTVRDSALAREQDVQMNLQQMQAEYGAASISPPRGPSNQRPNGSGIVAVPTTVFDAQYENIKKTISKLIAPSQRERLTAIVACLRRQKRRAEPVEISFVTSLRDIVMVQLRALEQLSVETRIPLQSPQHLHPRGTHSTALVSLWNLCETVRLNCDEVLTGAKVRNASYSSLTLSSPPHRNKAQQQTNNSSENSPQHLDRGVPSTVTGKEGLRPSTQILRYPPAVASFLGPNQRNRGRVSLSDANLLVAQLLQPVEPTSLGAIAEKRRLFAKKYGAAEGEQRFSLWVEEHGPEWTMALYKELDRRKLTLMEALKYE